MAKNDTPKKKPVARKSKAAPVPKDDAAPEITWQHRLGQEMAALLLLGLAGFFLLALGSHTPADPQGLVAMYQAAAVHNTTGKIGALLAAYLIGGLGLAAFWLPVMFLGLAWQSHREGLDDLGWPQTVSALGVLLASAGLLSLGWPAVRWGGELIYGGGAAGQFIAGGLRASLNPMGAALALALTLLISFMGATRLSYVGLMAWAGQGLRRRWGKTPAPEDDEMPVAPPYRPRRPKVGGQIITPTDEAAEPLLTPAVTTTPPPAPEAAGAKSRKDAPIPGAYTLPSLDLLDPSPPWNHQVQENAMVTQAKSWKTPCGISGWTAG